MRIRLDRYRTPPARLRSRGALGAGAHPIPRRATLGAQFLGGPPRHQGQVQVGPDARAPRGTRTGSRSRSAWPSRRCRGLRSRSSSRSGGCSPWKVRSTGGSPSDRDLEALALGPEAPGRVAGGARRPSASSRATVITGSPRDRSLPGESLRRDRALLDGADRRVDRPRWRRPSRGWRASRRRARSPGRPPPCRSTARSRAPSMSSIGLFAAHLGRLAEQHHLAHDELGRVGADVGELLGAHVADVAAERRDHQREALGDAAGVDAGAVQRDAALAAGGLELRRPRRAMATGRTSPAASRRSCPLRGCARPSLGLSEHRAVEDAVGVHREQGVGVAWWRRRRSGAMPHRSRRRRGRPSPRLCTQAPTSSSSGWASMPSIAARPTLPVAHWMTL